MQTAAVAVRYPDLDTLAAAWSPRTGTLAVHSAILRPGSRILVDGTVGNERFLVGGQVVGIEGGEPAVRLHPDGRSEVEALLSPDGEGRRSRERWPVHVPGLVSGRHLVRCADLSDGGARLFFGKVQAPEVGALIYLALYPCDAPVIPAPILAHIAWRSPDGHTAGCSFPQGSAASALTLLGERRVWQPAVA